MKWPLYTQVALLKDVPEEGLSAGDTVTTVDFLESPKPGVPNGYFVEAFNAMGKTIAVFIVYEDDIEVLTEYDVLSRRTLEDAQVRIIDQQNNWHIQDLNYPDETAKETATFLGVDINLPPEKTPEPSTPRVNPWSVLLSDLPIDLLNQKAVTPEDIRLQLAIILYQKDIFSLGKASDFIGLHPTQFQEELANLQIPIHYNSDDYKEDNNRAHCG